MANYPYLDWLNQVMAECDYPAETVDYVIKTYKTICENPIANTRLHDALALYEKKYMHEYYWGLTSAERAAAAINEHKYVGHFVFVLCLVKHIKVLYKTLDMPEGCFEGFLNDIKIKWAECLKVYGIQGVSVAAWFNRFLNATRHTVGRLQFEPIFISNEYNFAGYSLTEGDMVISIHIPGGSKLLKQDCIDSFLGAAKLYAPLFKDGAVIFHCSSWLLYEGHKEFLPETSNLRMFAEFFNIVSSSESNHDLWRIFDTEEVENIAALPEKTSLQRAYKKRLLEGGKIGNSRGFFVVKDGKFIK